LVSAAAALTLPSSYSVIHTDTDKKTPLITLHYEFDETKKSVTLGVVATNAPFGFIGIGLGRDDMAGTDMVIAQVVNGAVKIDDYWSAKHGPPSLDSTIPGCKSSYSLLDSLVNSTHLLYTFSRSIAPEDTCDFPLNQDDSLLLGYAWKNTSDISFHGDNFGQVKVNFTQGFQGYAVPSQEDEQSFLTTKFLRYLKF